MDLINGKIMTNIEMETLSLAKSFFKEAIGAIMRSKKPVHVKFFTTHNERGNATDIQEAVEEFCGKVDVVDVKRDESGNLVSYIVTYRER